VRSWRATDNALEGVAALHNDNTLMLDEIGQFDPTKASEIAYSLFNGRGKERMSRNISLHRTLKWRILCLSSGEVTLAEHAATANKRVKAGSEIRLINLPSAGGAGMGVFENLHDVSSPALFSQILKQASHEHSGYALRAFLSILVAKREQASEMLRATRKPFREDYLPDGSSNEAGRGADRFSLIATAGELATEWGITGWQPGEATWAAKRCFYDWLAWRGGTHSADVQAAVTRLWTLIEKFGASRFHRANDSDSRVNDRAGFIRTIDNRTEYLILPNIFREEICAGADYRAVAHFLEEKGNLRRQAPHWTIRTSLPGLGKKDVYCILAAVSDEE
jgi:putative DNA primase/helicase